MARPILPGVEELHIPRETMEIPEGLSASEFLGLRQQFLEEGVELSREFEAGLDKHVDGLRLAHQLHRWAGSAGQLGFHNILELVRRAERLLRAFRQAEVRTVLGELLVAFTDLRDKTAGVPDHFVKVLGGKSVAVIGFSEARTNLACTSLGGVGARPRTFSTADLGCESVRDCDLVMVHLSPGLDRRKLQAAAEGSLSGKLILAGERSHMMALPPAFQSLVADFLFNGWEADELLMRLAMVSQRKPGFGGSEKAGFHAGEMRLRATTNPRVVAVDDDAIILSVLATTFRNQGIQCQTATNGPDALRLIRAVEPNIVVLDVNMPGIDGFEVLSAIRTEGLSAQVVLLTARQQEHDVLRGFQLGADDYLVKPFSPPELIARITRLLVKTHKTAA